MDSLRERCAIAVMAKAPRPGQVKTRLQGVVTPEEAALLGAAFLRDTVENLHLAARSAPIAPFVAYAPAGQEGRFDGLLPAGTGLLLADGSGGAAEGVEGFGRVLLGTMRALLGMGYGAACVLAADCPTLPTAELVRCARVLTDGTCDATFGESDDGGYYVLGLRSALPEPFAGVRWSTPFAAGDTRARLSAQRLVMVHLRPWFDVDDPLALRRLLHDRSGYRAVHTEAVLAACGLRERLGRAA